MIKFLAAMRSVQGSKLILIRAVGSALGPQLRGSWGVSAGTPAQVSDGIDVMTY